MITIVGGGLAGSEAAWQAASSGTPVTLYEMRPARSTAVHRTGALAELVCSNSFRGDKLDNAVGLLKEEMRRLGSLIMWAAERCRVPAGAALAVDRERFAATVTDAIAGHPLITVVREELAAIPASTERDPVIVATGPLTSALLSADIARLVGGEHLSFYDAISPIVLSESIDRGKVFRASRWDRSLRRGGRLTNSTAESAPAATSEGGPAFAPARPGAERHGDPSEGASVSSHLRASGASAEKPRWGWGPSATEETPAPAGPACGVDDGEGDYLNCPFTRDEYARFYDALAHAESATVHDFDKEKFFEGCLPIEVMAHRGVDTLRFGPMKPVGLIDPRQLSTTSVRWTCSRSGTPS
jgi:methylenetetrahydrofolate--tRNA-(uracil-5-)-methyltransferase